MAYEESLKSISLNADSSLAVFTGVPSTPGSADPNYGKQYTFVKVTGAHQVGAVDGVDDPTVGVLQNKPQVEGQAATVGIFGVSNVIAGAAVVAGVNVQSDTSGRAITLAAGTAVGVALSAAAGAGELISVLLRRA
jgi:hypothetical protein